MRLFILAILMSVMAGCSNDYDNLVYKYGNGIKNGIEGASKAIACVYVGGATWGVAGAALGYIDGKQQARKNIVSKEDAKFIKRIAEKEAKDQGVDLKDSCWFFFCN